MAVRLTLAVAPSSERGRKGIAASAASVMAAIEQRPRETYLRHELHGGSASPALAARGQQTLAGGRPRTIQRLFSEYVAQKRL